MTGELNYRGGLRPGFAPGTADLTSEKLSFPAVVSPTTQSPEGPNSFAQETRTLAEMFFPGCREASHVVAFAGLFALVRLGTGSWLDGSCSDTEFVKSHTSVLADIRQIPLARMKTFVRENTNALEAIAEFLKTPPSPPNRAPTFPLIAIASSLVHTGRALARGAPTDALVAESLTALDLARRLDPVLLSQWKGMVRHILRLGIDELHARSMGDITPEVLAWQRENPCICLLPMLCVVDTQKTYLAGILEGSRLLATTGVLHSCVEEAGHLGSEAALTLFERTVTRVSDILPRLSKDRSNAAGALLSLVGQLPMSDRLPLIDVLASDARATDLSRRLEGYGLLKRDTAYASWLIVHRERIVEIAGRSTPFADHLLELAQSRPGIRPALVTLVSWSDQFAGADLIAPALALTKSPLDPSKVEQRIDAAGEALQHGATTDEVRAILDRGLAPKDDGPWNSSQGGARVSMPRVSTPVQSVLCERLAGEPDLQEWVARTFDSAVGQTEILRCLRRLAAMPPEVTPRFVAFLRDYGAGPRCREFVVSPSAFERLTRFLSVGRHEEIREFKEWLRGDTITEPTALRVLRGLRAGPSAAVEAAEAEERGKALERPEIIFIPPGAYQRLVVVGGVYSQPKRSAIQEAAGQIPVIFLSPDDDPRSIRQTLMRNDLVVINPTWNSHSTTERVMAQCRTNDITWVMVPFSGYKAVARIAERIQR